MIAKVTPPVERKSWHVTSLIRITTLGERGAYSADTVGPTSEEMDGS